MNTAWVTRVTVLVALATGWGCDRTEAARDSPTGARLDRSGVTNRQPANTAAEQSPGGTPEPQTVDVFANAWCEQQRSCEHIGEGRLYSDFAACTGAMQTAAVNDLARYGCSRGADPTGTEECQAAIERVDCAHTPLTLSSLAICARDKVCAK